MSDQYKPRFSKVWHFESAEDITQFFLNDDFFKTRNVYDAAAIGKGGMIFRGHSNADWSLVPRAFRLDNPLKGYTPQPPVDFYSDSKRFDPYHLHPQLGLHLHAEVRSVTLFLDYADRVGLSTPIDPIAARETPAELKAAFEEDFEHQFLEPFPEAKFERAFALAQHYGVPTRFLDWTESPLTALYFAAIGAVKRDPTSVENQSFGTGESEHIHEGNMAVIFVASGNLRKAESDCSLIMVPRHENANLRAQMGVFTYIKSTNQRLVENNWWPAMTDDVFSGLPIYCATLPVEQSIRALQILHDLNITTLTMQPSLENAAKAHQHVERLYRDRT